jgi:hypothetical protein
MPTELVLNPWAVAAAAASTFVLGGLWYSLLFAKAWQAAAGVTDEQLKRGQARVFIGSALLAIVQALSLAAFIGAGGAAFGTAAGAAAGITWVATAFGVNYLFERRPLRLYLINAGYNVLAFTLMGLLIGIIQT